MSLEDQIMAIERDAYSLVADARGEAKKSWDRLTNTRPESLRLAAWRILAETASEAFFAARISGFAASASLMAFLRDSSSAPWTGESDAARRMYVKVLRGMGSSLY